MLINSQKKISMKAKYLTVTAGFLVATLIAATQLSAADKHFNGVERHALMGIWSEDCADPSAFFTLINLTHVLTLSNPDDEAYYSDLESSWLNDADLDFELNQNELNWVFRALGGDEVYTDQRCAQLPPNLSLLHGEAAHFFFTSSAIAQQCLLSRETCAAAMMSHFDRAKTGGLNEADIARLLRIATYFGTLDNVESTAPFEDLLIGQAVAMSFAPLVARTLIRNFDYDGDNQLSAQEIAMDRGLFDATYLAPNGGSGERIRELLEQIEQLFLLFQ